MKIAAIYPSPYNNQFKRLQVLSTNNLPNHPVSLVAVEVISGTRETGGLPYCMYNGEIYRYNNGQYYHEKYMEGSKFVVKTMEDVYKHALNL